MSVLVPCEGLLTYRQMAQICGDKMLMMKMQKPRIRRQLRNERQPVPREGFGRISPDHALRNEPRRAALTSRMVSQGPHRPEPVSLCRLGRSTTHRWKPQ